MSNPLDFMVYNLLRKGIDLNSSQLVTNNITNNISNTLYLDDTNTGTSFNRIMNIPCIDFEPSLAGSCWTSINTMSASAGSHINLDLVYVMSGTSTGTVDLQIDIYPVYSTFPSSPISTQTITIQPNPVDERVFVENFHSFDISSLSSLNCTLVYKFTRPSTDTYTGTFKLLNILFRFV